MTIRVGSVLAALLCGNITARATTTAACAAQPSVGQKIPAHKRIRRRRPRPNTPPINDITTKTKILAKSGAGTPACALTTTHQPPAQLTPAAPVEPKKTPSQQQKSLARIARPFATLLLAKSASLDQPGQVS